jgi:adenine modification enzyme
MTALVKDCHSDWIYSPQPSLVGHRDVIGFGNGTLCVKLIECEEALEMVRLNHYSRSVVRNSTEHFGVFSSSHPGEIMGVLQWGYAMNPASVEKIVPGVPRSDMRELNRMWVSDALGRNAETMAIGYSIKVLRRINRKLSWLQSFADERCGRAGVVYQAAGFHCYGVHESEFYVLDGVAFHKIALVERRDSGDKARMLQSMVPQAQRQTLRQWRYLRFLWPKLEATCTLKRIESPKMFTAGGVPQ